MSAGDLTARVQALGIDARARTGLVLIEDENVEGAADAVLRALSALAALGCRVDERPADGRTLLRRLWRGMDEASADRETLPLPDYARWLATLPPGYERKLAEGWKRPEDDPLFRPGTLDCGHFPIPATRCGDAAVVAWSMRAKPSAASTPPHGHLAAIAWLRDVFGAHSVLTIDGKGTVAVVPPPF